MVGARASIAVAIVAVGIGLVVGVPLGLAAATRRGSLAGRDHHAHQRPRLRLPGAADGHHDHRRLRARRRQRHHRDRHLQHPGLRAPVAWGGPVAVDARLRARRPCRRQERRAHLGRAHPAQHPQPARRAGHDPVLPRHPRRGEPFLCRPRHPAADAELGPHAGGIADADFLRAMDGDLSGRRDRAHRPRAQRHGRRPARRPRPQAEAQRDDRRTAPDRRASRSVDPRPADPEGCRPARRGRRSARHRRRVGLRQEHDRERDHAAASRRRRMVRRREPRRRTAGREEREGDVRHSRPRHRHGLPGADDGAQPGPDDRRPGRRDDPHPHRQERRRGARDRPRDAEPRRSAGRPLSARPLSARPFRRPEAARRHRHGDRPEAEAARSPTSRRPPSTSRRRRRS